MSFTPKENFLDETLQAHWIMFYSFLQTTALPAAHLHLLLHVLLTSGTGHQLDISPYVPQYVNSELIFCVR